MYTLENAHRDGWKGDEAQRFVEWKAQVDAALVSISGLGCDDVEDYRYADAFISQMEPVETAHDVLLNADFPEDLL